MEEHGIPAVYPGTRLRSRDHVRKEWGSLRGTTAPPGPGTDQFAKCAFLKASQLEKEASNHPILYANQILHEFGHMNGITRVGYAHPPGHTAMSTRLTTRTITDALLEYTAPHAQQIVIKVRQLWQAQRVFVRFP